MQKPLFKLEVYEGPLDLLLDLIKNSKIDILDINISEILDQYFLYLTTMEQMNLDLTADFLVMASQLLLIKSKMLLPKAEFEQEEDPRKDLTQMLLEYQRCKKRAQVLKQCKERCGEVFVKAPMKIEIPKAYKQHMPLSSLANAYLSVLIKSKRRMPPQINSFVNIVGREIYPVGQKVKELFSWLKQKRKVDFKFLFSKAQTRSEMVATFLAVLEMAKNKKVWIMDDSNFNYQLEIKK